MISSIAHAVKGKAVSRNNSLIYLQTVPVAIDGGQINFRLLLSSLAYFLLDTIRRLVLQGTELAQALCEHIAP